MESWLLPLGRGKVKLSLEKKYVRGVLRSTLDEYTPEYGEAELVARSMERPEAGPRLQELAKGKRRATIIISDHTRPVPSKIILPPMLAALRQGNPDIDITLLVATGFHRLTTKAELVAKLGEEMAASEKIVVHDSADDSQLVEIGVLPSGARLIVNRLAVETDLLLAEGFIEPHFFAGFSGGRKSVLPGVSSRTTVLGNHCSKFIASPNARTGNLENNPIHEDMLEAARLAKLAYIVNVVINSEKKTVAAFAGEPEPAHAAGCAFLRRFCGAKAVPADIVITTNAGYPLDQNIYQSVKGMSAAESCGDKGSVIIILADCEDGTGSDDFYRAVRDCESPAKLLGEVLEIPQSETKPDQWEYQILARILENHTVILVSESCSPDIVTDMKMLHAPTVDAAVSMAREIKGADASFTIIPDGVGVMVYA